MLNRRIPFTAVLCLCTAVSVRADLGPLPVPLSTPGFNVPAVPGLLDGADPIVVNEEKALVLGKALFWDMNVGSDGMACASCHFHAGADPRTKNQLSPSGKNAAINPDVFDATASGGIGPNYTMRTDDYPFHKRDNPLFLDSTIIFDSDDVTSSSGTFGGEFNSVAWYGGHEDDCSRSADPVFHVGAIGTRKVEPRNAPSVINAVFNHRNLWDGSANNVFNGSSPWGPRDPDAGVWIRQADGSVVKQRLNLINSSLASQALSPPLSTIEMGCGNRTFADLGRKLMWRRPLEHQDVHWNDSVLGTYANSTPGNLQKGLNTFYITLVREAFNPKYWSHTSRDEAVFGGPPAQAPATTLPYNQFEANFSMFFALAIQLYEATLISDQSPFDLSARDSATNNFPIDLTAEELEGMRLFREAHCNICHVGPAFSSATITPIVEMLAVNPDALLSPNPDTLQGGINVALSANVVTRDTLLMGTAFHDVGFADSGVMEQGFDPGVGGVDPFGNPLSFSGQYMQLLAGNTAAVVDADVNDVRPCDFQKPLALDIAVAHPFIFTQADGIKPQTQNTDNCFNTAASFLPTEAAAAVELADPASKKMHAGVANAFKIPQLRNVELTGPFMHNGSMSTLEQVIEFYARQGNFQTSGSFHFGTVFEQPDFQFDATKANMNAILAFMRTLTDPRVKNESAPFDHPQLAVPHGHSGDHNAISAINSLGAELGQDEFIIVPAIGSGGRSALNPPLPPLKSFADMLAP